MKTKVECYAGYRGEQEPRAFNAEGRCLQVRAIVARWLEPGRRCFKCLADDGLVHELRQAEQSGEWELVSLTPSSSREG